MVGISLIQFGAGRVGRALIEETIRQLKPRFLAILDRSGGAIEDEGLDKEALKAILVAKAEGRSIASLPFGVGRGEATARVEGLLRKRKLSPKDMKESIDGKSAEPREQTERVFVRGQGIVVDVTAEEGMTEPLIEALERGWGVVLANKKPLVAPLPTYRRLFAAGRLRYEATVGAGLPVIATLESLLKTGDDVRHIWGLLSGTLGYILSRLEEGGPFSAAVREAWERGYTEPHPAEDLLGMDVARKALILARTMGLPLELEDVAVEGLCPPEMANLAVDEFLEDLRCFDEGFRKQFEEGGWRGRTLRYVAEISAEGCKVGLREVERDGPLGMARGPENVIIFETKRYEVHPLVISGPGAGPLCAAAGILADVVRLASG